ncbi:Cytoplasmic tRNA 2-thiolation protein 2 [Irineochytrium annulatum]|nr:Cytoplasmic tRNA 2-thiolation protein 2 [Irineochytrium annulatum]
MSLCIKCKKEPATITIRDAFCSSCFVKFVNGRFRRSFISAQCIPLGKKALVAVSGGISSRLLLQYLSEFQQSVPKDSRRFSDVLVCHVDTGEPDDVASGDIVGFVESLGYTYKTVRLDSIFLDARGFVTEKAVPQNPDHLFLMRAPTADVDTAPGLMHQLVASITTKGSVTSLKKKFLKRLLVSTAIAEECSTIVMATNASVIASIIVSKTAEGGGFSLPKEVGLEETTANGIVIFRPLRELLVEEIEAVASATGLQSKSSAAVVTPPEDYPLSSIEDLCHSGFPANGEHRHPNGGENIHLHI